MRVIVPPILTCAAVSMTILGSRRWFNSAQDFHCCAGSGCVWQHKQHMSQRALDRLAPQMVVKRLQDFHPQLVSEAVIHQPGPDT